MARTKKTCDHNCFRCIYDDCVVAQSDITTTERLESSMRDNVYQTYGTVTPAKRTRKNRGRRT